MNQNNSILFIQNRYFISAYYFKCVNSKANKPFYWLLMDTKTI